MLHALQLEGCTRYQHVVDGFNVWFTKHMDKVLDLYLVPY